MIVPVNVYLSIIDRMRASRDKAQERVSDKIREHSDYILAGDHTGALVANAQLNVSLRHLEEVLKMIVDVTKILEGE